MKKGVRVFKKGRKKYTWQDIAKATKLGKDGALKRLRRWEKRELSDEKLFKMNMSLGKAKPAKASRLQKQLDLERQMLERIPEPSDLERSIFG